MLKALYENDKTAWTNGTSAQPPAIRDTPMNPPRPLTQREKIARMIRTTRLQAAEKTAMNRVRILFSPLSPADDRDLALADLVIKDLMSDTDRAK